MTRAGGGLSLMKKPERYYCAIIFPVFYFILLFWTQLEPCQLVTIPVIYVCKVVFFPSFLFQLGYTKKQEERQFRGIVNLEVIFHDNAAILIVAIFTSLVVF